MKPISRQLAEWCAGVELADLPIEIRNLIPARLLDTAGLIIAGSATPAAKTARKFATLNGGNAESSVIGSVVRVPSSSAALVHGIAAHCFDFDDTFSDSVVHPGSVAIPTAMAVAEAHSSSDVDFRVAITVGYEVAARVGAIAGRLFHARHMHPTGMVGPLVAAAVAGRLRRLSAEQISWAVGLAASMSGGIRAYAKDGGWSKWLHVGWAAHGGIVAVDLASKGFRGPEHVLDGGNDLYSAMLHGEDVDRSILLADLGRDWKGAAAEFKYYPCAHVIQPFIDAVLAVVEKERLLASDIEQIECAIAPWAAAIVCEPRDAKLRFNTELEAIGSLPYQLAVAVLEKRLGLEALSEPMRARHDVRELSRRIVHRTDAALGRSFDGSVEIRTKSRGTIVRPATLAAFDVKKLQNKFISLVEPAIGKACADDLSSQVLKSHGDWQTITKLLRSVNLPCGD